MSAHCWPVSRARMAPIRFAVALLTALTLVLGTVPSSASAMSAGTGFAVGDTVVAIDLLNMRSSPSLGASVLHVLDQGDTMRVAGGPEYADGYSWYALETWMAGPITGWAAGEYLALVADDGSGDHIFQIGDTVAVDTPRLNGRSGPGLGYAVNWILQGGDPAVVIDGPVHADGYQWYQLDIGGGIVWAIGEGLVASDGVWDPGFAIGDRVVVAVPGLNFRSAPGLSAPILLTLAQGRALTVVGGSVPADGYDWFEVQTSAHTGAAIGWVIGPGLAIANPEAPGGGLEWDIGETAVVATDALNLRSAAGFGASVLQVLPWGTGVTVTGRPIGADGYTWYPVTTDSGASGWVAGQYLD